SRASGRIGGLRALSEDLTEKLLTQKHNCYRVSTTISEAKLLAQRPGEDTTGDDTAKIPPRDLRYGVATYSAGEGTDAAHRRPRYRDGFRLLLAAGIRRAQKASDA